MPILGIIASQQPGKIATLAYDSIATQVVSSATSSITFSSIPSTYKHLQVRAFVRGTTGGRLQMRYNGDTGSNYALHTIIGGGSTAFATSVTSTTTMQLSYTDGDPNIFCANVVDIFDYTNTNKYKTMRALGGYDKNTATSGEASFWSGLWMNTAAVSSITFFYSSGNLDQYSHFGLYGIKG